MAAAKWVRISCGALLIVEGLAGGLLSFPMTVFAGVGLIGLFGAVTAIWLGVSMISSRIQDRKLAAVGALAAGVLLALPITALVLFSNCGIMGGGCSRNAEWLIVGIPLLIVLFNALCGMVIIRNNPAPIRD
jgi:hypothetical protein